MKTIKYLGITLSLMLLFSSCEQEVKDLMDPCEADPESCAPDTSCEDADDGSADFSKFIAIGNSFVAGVQGGALFTEAQNNSLAVIINKQLQCAGGDQTFKQPDIKATLGWNLFVTQSFPTNPVLGRMLLQYGTTPDCATGAISPRPTPQAYASNANIEAVPNPAVNADFLVTDAEVLKTDLNNFAAPAITVGQALSAATGNWADPDPAKGFQPFYARFATAPGTSNMITDANAAGGTFALVWLGLDDFLLHAAFGGDPTKAPLTANGDFSTRFGAVFGHPAIGLLTVNPNLKAVVGNFPNIFAMPHFQLVKYNPIPLDAGTVTQLNSEEAFGGYNAVLDALIANAGALGINDALKDEIASRKVTYVAGCTNKMILIDETLADLGGYFDILQGMGAISAAQRTGLIPYEQIRQSTPTDIIPLSTGSILGTLVGGNPQMVMGVTVPLADQYVLIPSEIQAIEAARTSYNATVAAVVANFPDNLVLADVNTAFNGLLAAPGGITYSGTIAISPSLPPPTGIFSEDGIHPNARGYAFLANVFISAINAKFGSTVPPANLADYSITGLPIQ